MNIVYQKIKLSAGYISAKMELRGRKTNRLMLQKTYYKTKDYCKVKFNFKPELAETVELLGLNSDWQNSIIMSKKKDGSFSAEVNLPKDSKHEFKYLVNNSLWLNDPEADAEVPNVFGGSNSVVTL
jgi:Glycogen recognition site of AMP-activated protein kinase